MSGKNYELSLVMRLRNMASREFNLAQRDFQAGIDKTNKATANLTKTVSQYHKTRDAAAVLGIRSERDIQREIQRTQAAYDRLAKSGTMSMRDQTRAAEAARSKIRELNNEMGKYSLGQRAMRGLQTGASIAAGVAAGGYVMSKPINQTMDYGVRLAQMSNTAFSDRNTLGRIMGKRELDAAIVQAVRHGGGTREGAAGALDTLIASGAMSSKDSMSMLPSLMRASTASGADAGELAQIGIRGMQTMGIKPGEMGKILDMAITAGQQGGFELKDMARWLPQQMAAAKLSGISGTSGMAKLLAANQASAITAGTKDEAGNNLVNLLAKINSRDTAVDAQRMGINLSGTIAAARGKGMDSLDAFVGVVDSVVAKNAEFQALQAKLKTATGADRRDVLSSQADILQGSAIGQLVQDRQALMALVGIMGNRGYMAEVQKKTLSGEGAAEKNYAVIAEEAGFKVQQAANEKAIATQNAFEKLTPLVGSVADGFTAIAQQYPIMTAGMIAATTALTALAVAAGAASITSSLGKGAGLTGLLAGGKNLVRGAGGMLGRGAVTLGGAALSLTGAAVAGSGAVGYGLGTLGYKAIDQTTFADNLGGMLATIMAKLGSDEAEKALNVTLHLDGEQIAQAVNLRNARTSSRY